jgi:tRNA(Ile)-lysidine synthase
MQIGIFSEPQSNIDILFRTELDMTQIAALTEPLVCRTRKPGDKMYLKNIGHKSIKKVFQDKNVPWEERGCTPLLAYRSDIVWIPGVCRSDSYLAEDTFPKYYGLVSRIRMTAPN